MDGQYVRRMGLRTRRRLIVGGITAVIVVFAAAVFVFARSPGGSASRGPDRSTSVVYGIFGAFGIAYGTTPRQLLARAGEPDRKSNGCRTYVIRGGTFNGIKLLPQIAGMDAVRYCFFDGVVSIIADHWRPGQKRSPAPGPWTPLLEFGCGGRPCRQTS